MGKWLDLLLPPVVPTKESARTQLPSTAVKTGGVPARSSVPANTDLPKESVVYGIGAAVLFAVGLVSLLSGRWFSGLLLLLPAGCLLGFAVHHLRYPR